MIFKNKVLSIFLVVCFAVACLNGIVPAQQQMPQARVDAVYFFGHGDQDLEKLKKALPFRVGDKFVSPLPLIETRPKVEQAVRKAAGLPVTDVSFVSPGGESWLVYIGLAGPSVKPFRHIAAPTGTERLPVEAMRIYRETNAAFMNAMMAGRTSEDDSRGFALSCDDEQLRSQQLAMHEYAVKNEAVIVDVLRNSGDVEHRRAAAQLFGYAISSQQQIKELVRASRDTDDTVRNNATRALIVHARSEAKTASMIPADSFIEMLNSGEWSDRNKAGGLLGELTRSRSPKLLKTLRSRAFESMAEMARWETGHAQPAREMLGRIAGIDEKKLVALVADDAQTTTIIQAARAKN